MEEKKELLAQAFLSVKTPEECWALLEDLCTEKEAEDMANRFAIAKMLDEKKTFVEIEALTRASSATISRVNRCLKNGGGYRKAIDRIDGHEKGNEKGNEEAF